MRARITSKNATMNLTTFNKQSKGRLRTGETSGAHQRSFNLRGYPSENKEQGPLNLYKEFIKRRPMSSCRLDAPFFLL